MTNLDRGHYEQDELWGAQNVALPDHQLQRMAAIDELLPADATAVLDIGAGDGRVLQHLLRERPDLTTAVAVERSRSALGHAVGTTRVQGSIDAVPVADRSVDTVLCCEVLEHLPDPVYRDALVELARIADRYVVVTVPNREVRRRADVTCTQCGCRYNRERHLRSFTPERVADLLPGFELDDVRECGPRQPLYPRMVRTGLERVGLLPVLGSPTCPQCGAEYRPRPSTAVRPEAAETRSAPTEATGGSATSRYRTLRRLAPKQRHPYWLCVRYSRTSLSR